MWKVSSHIPDGSYGVVRSNARQYCRAKFSISISTLLDLERFQTVKRELTRTNPLVHSQEKLPTVFSHITWQSPLFLRHSSSSTQMESVNKYDMKQSFITCRKINLSQSNTFYGLKGHVDCKQFPQRIPKRLIYLSYIGMYTYKAVRLK